MPGNQEELKDKTRRRSKHKDGQMSIFPSAFTGLVTKTDDGAPKAYLNWLVFDRNYTFLTGGFKQITTICKETGTDVAHEYLSSGNFTITQPGYMYIYLSNESASPVEVYFDDFKVTQTKSPVIQQDFYPFGLPFNSYTRENTVPQNYLYNEKENINDLGINWDDYGARMYDPALGRWGAVDPMSEKYRRWSPYTYAIDNPLRYIDPDGMDVWQSGSATNFNGADAALLLMSLQIQSLFHDENSVVESGAQGQGGASGSRSD